MTKLWIRVDADAPDDPAINDLADRLSIDPMQALGHCMAVWAVIAKHATSGDLSTVTDVTLERWARWTKRRGLFAPVFRELFVGEDGQLHGWGSRQGALISRMERDRKRHKRNGNSAESGGKFRGVSTEEANNLHGKSPSTVRNGTVRNRKARSKATTAAPVVAGLPAGEHDTSPSPDPVPAAVDPPKSGGAAKYPAFPLDVCLRLHACWLKARGAVDVGRFRKTLAPLYPHDGPLFTEAQLVNAIEFHVFRSKQAGGFEWRTCTPETLVANIQENVRLGNMQSVDETGGFTERGQLLHGGPA